MIRDPESLNALLDSVARFVRERLVPAEDEVAEADRIPPDIIDEMRRLGLFGLTIPEAYGGLGRTALTEPEAGSDAASLRTTAIREQGGDHYVVNGTKRFITNAPEAGIFTLMARTNPADKGASGISAFIVDAKSPGVSLGKIDRKMGQRGAHTCDVIFDDCRVPAANLIGLQGGRASAPR